ncbi:hypothetical protein LOAG_13690 [Loa loa]|uniref:Uncharacterized protein n=1 Tax=Loa loa TaxID=7209 RepID=A0A1S0TJK1_LOALO|nr:hypothetical protein LOAG_13690 [Loa loa]EFO14824.1 hypothetical protein LOAG_13690 [Loa loa]
MKQIFQLRAITKAYYMEIVKLMTVEIGVSQSEQKGDMSDKVKLDSVRSEVSDGTIDKDIGLIRRFEGLLSVHKKKKTDCKLWYLKQKYSQKSHRRKKHRYKEALLLIKETMKTGKLTGLKYYKERERKR